MIPRSADKVISDLGFRVGWLEKTVLMNVARLEEMAKQDLVPVDVLRAQIANLVDDTRKDLERLQICAVERMLAGSMGEKLQSASVPA